MLESRAVAIALVLVLGPWLWRLAPEREAERSARIRTQERAEMAARVHDSVLQTLALIQREAGDPRRVATLARRQERELRAWLYREPRPVEGESLVAAIEAAAAEVEELHGVPRRGRPHRRRAARRRLAALVLAAREAMTNAAKFSGADEVSVYVEAADGERRSSSATAASASTARPSRRTGAASPSRSRAGSRAGGARAIATSRARARRSSSAIAGSA